MSKLAQMQARFQQKQMQEKEEKLLKLYENQQQRAFERVGRGSAGSNNSNASLGSTGGGKVRQMFDERRQKAGVDKSYPLEPLKSKTRGVGLDKNLNTTSRTVTKTTVRKSISNIRNGKPEVRKEITQKSYNNNYTNGTYEEKGRFVENYDDIDSHSNLVDMMNNHNLSDSLDDEVMPKIGFNEEFKEKPLYMTGKLANVGGRLPSQMIETKPNTNGVGLRNTTNKTPAKVITKKPVAKFTPPPRANSTASSASSQSPRSSPARSLNNMSGKQPTSSSQRAPTNNRPSSKQLAKSPVVRDDLAECKYCGRRFATDRLGTHEDICGKTGKKKRKVFDTTKHRVQGTELEGYVLKGGKKGASSKASAKHPPPKANWRRTHEEFIAAIRAAKQAQAHVAKGGKLTDLPPPPPSTNPDYVQCPHCGRRFNEAAAQRHIPKCATFEFNKPKGGAPPKGRPGKH